MNDLFATKLRDGKYLGELTAQMAYNHSEATVTELYVDQETLRDRARETGWNCDIVVEQDNGRYPHSPATLMLSG
jgi:hypothetical protein